MSKEKKVLKEIVLSSGAIARIYEGKGKDLFFAMSNAVAQADIIKLLMIRLITIDNQPITEDTLEELPLMDAMILLRDFTEIYNPLLTPKQSSQ